MCARWAGLPTLDQQKRPLITLAGKCPLSTHCGHGLVDEGLAGSRSDRPKRRVQLPISSGSNIIRRHRDKPFRADTCIGLRLLREIADDWQVHFEPGTGQTNEKVGAAIDSAPAASSPLTDQRRQSGTLDRIGKLEGGRRATGIYEHRHRAREPSAPWHD